MQNDFAICDDCDLRDLFCNVIKKIPRITYQFVNAYRAMILFQKGQNPFLRGYEIVLRANWEYVQQTFFEYWLW
jgi:hypothetical protein